MDQKTDLYSILMFYANKNNSPFIEMNSILAFLDRRAKKYAAEDPAWQRWEQDKNLKFWSELSNLAEEGKCDLLTDTPEGRIYMTHYYNELLNEAYKNENEESSLPFPNEESIKVTLPEKQTRILNSEYDFPSYLDNPQKSDIPILKIHFPDEFGSALVLAGMIPRKLGEMAILKIRTYLRKGGNHEYVLRKLRPQLQGRESLLQNKITQILLRPHDCYKDLEKGSDFSHIFWAHFSILVKSDVKKKKERLSEDIATFQSICIIEAINEYSKAMAVKRREAELAFKSLEESLGKPPFLYSHDQLLRFTSPKGVLLLGQYTRDELEEWLHLKTTESDNNELPVLLIMQTSTNERCFLLKDKMLAFCVRLLAKARTQIKDSVLNNWRGLLLKYQHEPAMENDDAFEKTLLTHAKKICPDLINLFEDPRLYLVYKETEKTQNSAAHWEGIYNEGILLPYSSLFLIKRKDVLSEAKLLLPFWHSVPIISSIIAFFKSMSGKKKKPKKRAAEPEENEIILEETDRARELRDAAENLIFTLIPPGYSLESYMEDLESRWSRLIDKKARENLIIDVKTLLRDNLRRILKIQKSFKLTGESINQLAATIIAGYQALASLNARDSLITYSELYMLKLLGNIK